MLQKTGFTLQTIFSKWLTIFTLFTLMGSSIGSSQIKEESFQLDIRFLGLTLGHVFIGAIYTDDQYKVASILRSSNFLEIFVKRRVETKAEGRFEDGMIISDQYEMDSVIGNERKTKFIAFEDGSIFTYEANSTPVEVIVDVDDDDVISLDYLSGIYAVLRNKPFEELCNLIFHLKDGDRVALISIGAAERIRNNEVLCQSSYTRLKGFSQEEMLKEPNISFALQYEISKNDPSLFALKSVRFSSTYGQVTAISRN